MPRTTTGPRSCLECHRRKIKCDRSFPCSYCVKVKVHCHYPPPKRSQNQSDSSHLTSQNFISRIERIENTLLSFEQSLADIRQLVRATNSPQRLLINETELEGSHEPRVTSSCIQSQNQSSINISPSLDVSHPEPPHPSPTTILLLWQTFLGRVDPLLKIGHTPTVQKQIMEIIRGQNHPGIPMSALLFAICYAAVVTMPTKECWHEFNESKDKTLQRYRTGVENHLTLANDRQSSEIIVLQALMIYLICGRCDEAGPDVRDLTPVAINIAQKNGLHEDNPRLSFFDLEMRRRIWWHIYILDVRTAENFGTDPHIHEPSTRFKLPLNINDTILHPDMTEKPQTNSGKTEMLFSLVRFKISDFARRMVFSNNFCQQNGYKILSPLEKCKAIDEFRDQIEKEYLSYCDNNIPLDHITLTSSRLILVKLKLSVSKPQDRQNQHILSQECFRNTCMDVMEGSRLLRLYEKGKEWLWLFQTYLEWDALIYLFINLSLVPTGDGVSAAWRIADDVYEYWKNRGDVRLNGRWEQIEEFRSQALIAKDMFRYAPSLSVPEVSRRNGDGSIQLPGDNPGHQIGEEHEWAFSNAATALPEASSLIDMPTSGTGCQWSASILERYFELLDTEQSHAGPWL